MQKHCRLAVSSDLTLTPDYGISAVVVSNLSIIFGQTSQPVFFIETRSISFGTEVLSVPPANIRLAAQPKWRVTLMRGVPRQVG